jgi:hypothetical protein
MIAHNCYASYSWRVFQNNRFIGYVVAFTMTDANRRATEKYGKNIRIEKISAP